MSVNERTDGFSSEPEFFEALEEFPSTPRSSSRPQLPSNHTTPLSVRTRPLQPIEESSQSSEAFTAPSDDSEADLGNDSPTSTPPRVNPLSPFINGAFVSFEDLRNELNIVTQSYGYALRISGSHRNKKSGEVWKKQLQCDMGGKLRDRVQEEHRQRQRPSRVTDCPWRGYAKMTDGIWSLFVKNDMHNHGMTTAAAHPVLRRMTSATTGFIENETRRQLPVYKTLNELRAQDPALVIDKKDIYNARAKSRKHRLEGKTPLQGLFEDIRARDEWDCHGIYDEWDRLELFWFQHNQSRALLSNFHYVLFVDCTYKSNRYNMPLLVVTGITCSKRIFFVGFCLLASETEAMLVAALRVLRSKLYIDKIVMNTSYQNPEKEDGKVHFGLGQVTSRLIEAGELEPPKEEDFDPITFISDSAPALMNAIERVFPEQRHIICQWHMNKNVEARLTTYFGSGDEEQQAKQNWRRLWYKVLAAHSRDQFDRLSEQLKQLEPDSRFKTAENPTPLHSSVYKTYLAGKLKYKIVNFGIARIPHFGQKASSAGEASNSKLKERLYSSKLPIPQIVENVSEMIEEQFQDIIQFHEKGMVNIPPRHRQTGLFGYLIGYISPVAIGLMYDQYRIFTKDPWVLPQCSDVWSSIYGLPCAHKIQDAVYAKQPIRIWHLHDHWKFDKTIPDDVEIPIEDRLQEPAVVRRKKWTKKGTVTLDKSIRRLPSRFEITAQEKRKETQQIRASQSQSQRTQGSQVPRNEELQRQIEDENWRKLDEANQKVYNEVTAICTEFDPPLARKDAIKEHAIRDGMLTRPLEGVLSLAHQQNTTIPPPVDNTELDQLDDLDLPQLDALLQTVEEEASQTDDHLGRGKRQKRPARK